MQKDAAFAGSVPRYPKFCLLVGLIGDTDYGIYTCRLDQTSEVKA